MKKWFRSLLKFKIMIIFRLILLISILIFLGQKTIAQECPFPQASKELNGNNISANILNGGDLFWDRTNAFFSSEASQNPAASTIFSAGIWMGGFTEFSTSNPNLKISAAAYPREVSNDYSAGPLSENGTTDAETCANFDRLWEVNGSQIAGHISDFEDDGIIGIKHQSIYGYPGHQNPFFNDFHSFDLPNTPQGLAPFFDRDGDGIYNPDNGDFPLPSSVNKDNIPEHIIWGVFNDNGANNTTTQGDPVQAEIQLTAWAFPNCSEDSILNNTIFTSHKIIKRGTGSIDSLHIGMFVDFDIGCFTDDYIGCAPELNTFYGYNTDPLDGGFNGGCDAGVPTYGDNPPVQAVTYLNHNMNSFIITAAPPYDMILGPSYPVDFYNVLTGTWHDGIPITQGEWGYLSGGQQTSFLYDGNPNDPNSWSMNNIVPPFGDHRTMSSVEVGELSSGQFTTIDMAYTFYQNADSNNVQTVNMVYDNTPHIQQLYDNQFQSVCSATTSINNILKKNQIQLFPNPTTHLLNIKLENPQAVAFEVFDIYGKKVFEKAESFNADFQLPIEHLSEGIYFLKVKMDGEEVIQKFIKI